MENERFQDPQAQLARYREMRRQVSAVLTHDLRAPITAIVGFADLLDDENLTPRQKEYVQRILEACDKVVGVLEHVRRLLEEVEEANTHS